MVKVSSQFGGTKVVFEGWPSLYVGGFNFDLNDLPAPGEVLPCGTPVIVDEVNRTIVPVITASVKSVNGTTIVLDDLGFGNNPFKVGDTISELTSTTFTTASTKSATVTAKDGCTLTISAAIDGLAAGDPIIVVDGTSKKPKGNPNGLLPYDVVRDENAVAVDGDAAYANDRPVLTRRMPAINAAIKALLKEAGCSFIWSDRK